MTLNVLGHRNVFYRFRNVLFCALLFSGIFSLILIAATPRPSHNLKLKVLVDEIIQVKSSELSQDFDFDRRLSMAHYEGHDLLVTGRVASVTPLVLEGHHPYASVGVVFNKGAHVSVAATEGKVITLSCRSVKKRDASLSLFGCT